MHLAPAPPPPAPPARPQMVGPTLPHAPASAAVARRLRVRHATHYRYDRPVTRSTHLLHLCPRHDARQEVGAFELHVTIDGERADTLRVRAYPDVFGNVCHAFRVNRPYRELELVAESVTGLRELDPFAFSDELRRDERPRLPANWKPRERFALSHFLRSVELPDSQLDELFDYASGFARRANGDIIETMFAVNLELYNGYRYEPGSTHLATTPFETMRDRRGVCQDFAQLFVCLARLLDVPARYVCGYVHTGNDAAARAQSDASHAWVQLYLPQIGWVDFDPTNGTLPSHDHVTVAYGRMYGDATPTGGTIYGNAHESMDIDVTVKAV